MVTISQRTLGELQELAWPEGEAAQLVLLFCTREQARAGVHEVVRRRCPSATLVGATTAGHFIGPELHEAESVVTAVRFEHTEVRSLVACASAGGEPTGEALARQLPLDGLAAVVVLSDGIQINGSELSRGMAQVLPPEVPVVGALSADGLSFEMPLVLHDERWHSNAVVAVGLYGDRLQIEHGIGGGWRPFGPERVVTESRGSELVSLDGSSALDLYERYLEPLALEMPAAALRFPISVSTPAGERYVRTVQSIDPDAGSITMAGDVPTGATARLMRTHSEGLIDGAQAVAQGLSPVAARPEEPARRLVLAFSCVGRRVVMKGRTEEELLAITEPLGAGSALTGFYGYGELGPSVPGGPVSLHNQSITVLAVSET